MCIRDRDSLLSCQISPTMPVLGIGAPVRVWLPLMADKLRARLGIPEHTEVANAVGAAGGRIMEVVRILITPGNKCSCTVRKQATENKR